MEPKQKRLHDLLSTRDFAIENQRLVKSIDKQIDDLLKEDDLKPFIINLGNGYLPDDTLYYAILKNAPKVVKWALEKKSPIRNGVQSNGSPDYNADTINFALCNFGNLEIIETLLVNGAEITNPDWTFSIPNKMFRGDPDKFFGCLRLLFGTGVDLETMQDKRLKAEMIRLKSQMDNRATVAALDGFDTRADVRGSQESAAPSASPAASIGNKRESFAGFKAGFLYNKEGGKRSR